MLIKGTITNGNFTVSETPMRRSQLSPKDESKNMKTSLVVFYLLITIPFAILNHMASAQVPPQMVNNNGNGRVDDRSIGMATPINPAESGQQMDVSSTVEKGKCECGVFDSTNPSAGAKPILNDLLSEVTCDSNGSDTCQKMCSDARFVAGDRCPAMLCAVIGRSNGMKPSIFSRVCNNEGWVDTGLRSEHEVCCRDNIVIACKDIINGNIVAASP